MHVFKILKLNCRENFLIVFLYKLNKNALVFHIVYNTRIYYKSFLILYTRICIVFHVQ